MKRNMLLLAGSLGCLVQAQAQVFLSYAFEAYKPIPDLGEVAEVRTLALGGLPSREVSVTLSISGGAEGAFAGDYYAALGHDSAFAVLLNRVGRRQSSELGYGDPGLAVRFDDQAANGDIHNYRLTLFGSHQTPVGGPLTGTWAPDGRNVDPASVLDTSPRTTALSAFNGLSADGEWRVLVADVSPGGEGILTSWGLRLQVDPPADRTLSLAGARLEPSRQDQVLPNPLELQGAVEVGGWQNLTLGGQVSGPGRLIQASSGKLSLTGPNAFQGGVVLRSGALVVGHDGALGTGPLTLNSGRLEAIGGARSLANPVNLGGSVTFGGTASLTFALPATLAGNSSVTVENTAEFGAGIGQTGGCYGLTKAGSGALVLRGLSSYTGTTAVEEGRLVIEGALVSSPVEVNRGATLLGGGSVGPLTIRQGGVVSPGASPGTLSSGPQVWESGGVYLWEINRAEGNKGADPGWDWFNVSGTLTIAATREAPFTIRITSLTPGGNPGPVADFDSSGLYSWPLLSASEGITGFDPQMFALDRSGFANDLGEGRFELSLIGNDLALAFVPEPAAWGLIGGALALLAAVRKRVLSRVC